MTPNENEDFITLDNYDKIVKYQKEYNTHFEPTKPLFPIIDPTIPLPELFPKLEIIENLGYNPYRIENGYMEMDVLFPGGVVSYYKDEMYAYCIPYKIEIYGVTTEDGKQALNTERFNSIIFLTKLEEDEQLEENDLFYKIPDGPTLKIEVSEGEKEIPKEWWYTDKRG
ncbi:hypothetical protein A3K02_01965 [candidate division WS6 bacterium RIFOXYD1_FULL_33_8]|uniref:Uncharacterized protein n=1 Tax=candidate division WS6 bacterium GW2011_GWB1_33_6 TaxID=1619088 RepID=A0A0G0AF92_9BACT|nr:MAG: hypothetical protein UR36_C0005G0014 [candidate division WS6 bacterium GW2011_GWF1_33_233]KKP55061.1 MAG: hypothetical protein UR45_C0005G0014 [candidate division WS6 bacterium GW2011_WS6_33_547]KKP55238.1 MAG: hypothetical protein UR47_C0003G0014 [candidate division WS6 bacterium GW2011_GWB1_33_6]KKP82201.1 MAG: hypothetical protein UR84_C0006G0015 [candidate division WS6 bacterium GW2011_GWD1_35_594]OGC42586.1 MAG: hypothetical protein A3K02_01965 [candidate division WS6 bacterium RIF